MAQLAKPIDTTMTMPQVDSYDRRTLWEDIHALLLILLIVIAYHLQNALLLHEVQFGSAFRNATLQPVLAVGLALMVAAFILPLAKLRRSPVHSGAALILAVYAAYILICVILDFNLFGTFLGINPAVFTDRLRDDAPIALLEQHAALTAPLEWLALLAVVVLWQPWARLPVYARALNRNAAPLVVAVLVLLLWEELINLFQIQAFLLPSPSVIGSALLEVYPRLVSAAWNTFQNAFWGFAIGCGVGVLTGMVTARFSGFSQAVVPLAVGINAVPIIALAPIMNMWFGEANPASKIAIVALLTYFPAMISTVRGLNSVEQLSLELMRSYAANQWEVFTKVRLPSALPFIFSALKVATTLSMIGAIVSEYFGGSTAGLGFRIRDDAGLFRYPEAWSAIVVASLFGIGFYLLVSAAERAFMHWHVSFREKS